MKGFVCASASRSSVSQLSLIWMIAFVACSAEHAASGQLTTCPLRTWPAGWPGGFIASGGLGGGLGGGVRAQPTRMD